MEDRAHSRNRLLNFTGFFSSVGGFEGGGAPGPETPATVAVADMISGSAVEIGALTKGFGCFFAKTLS